MKEGEWERDRGFTWFSPEKLERFVELELVQVTVNSAIKRYYYRRRKFRSFCIIQKKCSKLHSIYIYKVTLSACLFATYRPHTFPGAALRYRLTRWPPCGSKWTCETRAEEVLKPHWLSVLQRCPAACRGSKRCSPLLFREQFTFHLTNGRSDETAFAGEHQSGETPTAYAYGCPLLQSNGGTVAPRNLADHRSQETAVQGTWRLIALNRLLFRETPDGHEIRRVWRAAFILFPKRQPEQVEARRERDERLYEETIVPGGQETKSLFFQKRKLLSCKFNEEQIFFLRVVCSPLDWLIGKREIWAELGERSDKLLSGARMPGQHRAGQLKPNILLYPAAIATTWAFKRERVRSPPEVRNYTGHTTYGADSRRACFGWPRLTCS